MTHKTHPQPINVLSKLPDGHINGILAFKVDFTPTIDKLVIRELMKKDD